MSAKYLKSFEAVFLMNHANGLKLSYARAAKVLRKSKAFVQKWVKRFTEVGNVDDLLERGRSREMTSKQDEMIMHLFRRNSTITLRQGQTLLRKKGLKYLFKSTLNYRTSFLSRLHIIEILPYTFSWHRLYIILHYFIPFYSYFAFFSPLSQH